MPTVILDRQKINTNARHNIAQSPLLDNVIRIRVRVERSTSVHPNSWKNVDTEIQMHSELSFDGGVTWEHPAGFIAFGGVILTEDVEEEETIFSFSIAPGVSRLIRGWIDKTTGPRLQTFITVETEP